jgi:hypothetical protein
MGIIFPSEGYALFIDRHDPVIGDCNPVDVTGEILQNMFGTVKWRFAINDPLLF